MDKFAQWKEMCRQIKSGECAGRTIISKDIFVLGDTVKELSDNINLFFESGGNSIELTDGVCIEKNMPRKVV